MHHLYGLQCSCPCHKSVVNNPVTKQCTESYCKCSLNIGLQSSNAQGPLNTFNLASTSENIGRMDHNTAFKPISNSVASGFRNDNDVLSKDFNILTLNNLRSDCLDARSPEKKANSTNKKKMTSLGKTFLTPADFLSTSEPSEKCDVSEISTVRRSIFPDVPSCVTPIHSSTSDNSRTPSRNTPLTVDECTFRLVAPDEFLNLSKNMLHNSPTPAKHTGTPLSDLDTQLKAMEMSNFKSSSMLTTHSPSATQLALSCLLSKSNGNSRSSAAHTLNASTKESSGLGVQPLNQFFAKIGVSKEHNRMLPTIPGGKNIVDRLDKPDTSIVASLKRGTEDNSDDAEKDVLLSIKDMKFKVKNGQKTYIAVFWDIENCQVCIYCMFILLSAEYKITKWSFYL